MKKIALITLLFGIHFLGYSQKIVENRVDDFTKKSVVRTDWEKVSATSHLYLNIRISKIDNLNILDVKIVTNSVASIGTSDDISFMFEDGSIINLKSTDYHLTNYGDGAVGLVGSKALGLNINCKLSDTDIEKFKTNLVKKIRINKSEGYSEDELKPKNAEKLKGLFLLMYP